VVVDFLKLQSRKVDLVLQHVLEKEVQEGEKFSGCQFGGSGIRLMSKEALPLGRQYKVTLFIHEELVAILCFAKVTACLVSQEGQSDGLQVQSPNAALPYLVDLEFSQILDADVEQLVKASLNVQQKQLKLRKQARDERQ